MEHPTRAQALTQPCPTCNAPPGQTCTGTNGTQRTALHRDRYHNIPATIRETRNYDLNTIGQPDCPLCETTGFVPITDPEDSTTRYAPCSCRSLNP